MPERKIAPTAGHRDAPVSWVRRGERLTGGQERAWTQYRGYYLIDAPTGQARASLDPSWRLDLNVCFPSRASQPDRPLVVEVGTGQGENIVAAASTHPDWDFLGVEVYTPGLAKTVRRAQEPDGGGSGEGSRLPDGGDSGEGSRLPNLKLLQADAPELLARALPAASVTELWVFFPDPWPKNRHLKRRLITPEFADLAARVLRSGGVWRLATDWPDYAEQIQLVAEGSAQFRNALGPGQAAPRFSGRVETAFERKAGRAGREIRDFAYLRR